MPNTLVGFGSVPALGTTIEAARRKPNSPFEYYLRLCDALFNRADESGHLKQLAHSFGHDIVNLATLAGRLLWYEGVTPDMWRSHDLVAVGVDAEAYFVMLQTACDIMADIIATLGTKPGQAPSDSFHRLNEWAIRHPWRLKPEFNFLACRLPWFDQINAVRTQLVHRGGDIWVYTERTSFEWDVMVPGRKVSRNKYLLSTFQKLTLSMLEFSKVLANVVLPQRELSHFEKKVLIGGVYVPALSHLLRKYVTPEKLKFRELQQNARLLAVCGGYVEAARLGYPDGFWWRTLVALSEALGVTPSSGSVFVRSSEEVHDCRFLFVKGGITIGVIACENVLGYTKWMAGAAESAQEFCDKQSLHKAVLIGRNGEGSIPHVLPGTEVALLVEGNSSDLARRAAVWLTS